MLNIFINHVISADTCSIPNYIWRLQQCKQHSEFYSDPTLSVPAKLPTSQATDGPNSGSSVVGHSNIGTIKTGKLALHIRKINVYYIPRSKHSLSIFIAFSHSICYTVHYTTDAIRLPMTQMSLFWPVLMSI